MLHQFKAKKAAGPDGLKPIIFSHLPEKYFGILEIIYKAMIFTSFTPTKWKEAKVIFIFKFDPDVNPLCRFCEEQNETFHHFITDCPRLRQFRTDTVGVFESKSWKPTELLNFSFIPQINDYLERKDYLVYENVQFLDHNYSLDDSL